MRNHCVASLACFWCRNYYEWWWNDLNFLLLLTSLPIFNTAMRVGRRNAANKKSGQKLVGAHTKCFSKKKEKTFKTKIIMQKNACVFSCYANFFFKVKDMNLYYTLNFHKIIFSWNTIKWRAYCSRFLFYYLYVFICIEIHLYGFVQNYMNSLCAEKIITTLYWRHNIYTYYIPGLYESRKTS